MSKKETIEVNIKKENPLFTILKNGKIPVIGISNKGFTNQSTFNYFKQVENFYGDDDNELIDILNSEKPIKGCFVCVGGILGDCVIYKESIENINIGYVEPNEKIYITNTYKNSKLKSFSYVTAKERYLDALENFEEKKNSLKKQNSEWLDFIGDIDSCSMAIIESYRIKKVTEIKVSDLGGLLQYSNNNFLKIFLKDISVSYLVEKRLLPADLYHSLGAEDVYLIRDDWLYSELVTKSIENYYKFNRFDYLPMKYIQESDKVAEIIKKNKDIKSVFFEYKESGEIFISFELFNEYRSLSVSNEMFKVSLTVDKYGKIKLWYNVRNFEKQFDIIIDFKQIFFNFFQNVIFCAVENYFLVYGLFNTYIDIEISNDMIKLMEIKNFLETIKKDDVFNYIKYKDELLETVYFFFCGNQIEYNLFLDDFVILKENDLCFNIENLPDDMDKENIIEYITDIYEKIKKTKLYKHIKKEGFSYPVFEK